MAGMARSEVVKLYREMMRAGEQFGIYNYREYAKRRIRDAFKDHLNEADPTKVNVLIQKAHKNLAMIKRQVSIGQMYHPTKLVIEKQSKSN